MTDAIVLAAGLGRRLAGAAAGPKWLAPVNGTCPAHVQLQAFEAAGIERVHVVAPPQRSAIDELVAAWTDRLVIDVVENPHAADRNNWYSLLLGFDACLAGRTGDVVVANSDLFADDRWLTSLLDDIGRAGSRCALAIDPTRGRTEEAMKVRLGGGGRLVTGIGKVGIDDPGGEYVGLAWWSRQGATELRAVLCGFLGDPARADCWYEHGIARHLDVGGRYAAVAVPSPAWVEIDDEHDLEAARRLPVGASSHG